MEHAPDEAAHPHDHEHRGTDAWHRPLGHVRGVDVTADTAQTSGMTRREAISARTVGADQLWMGQTHVAPTVSSGDHHHGAAETAIYVVSGHPVFVFAEGDREVRIDTEPGDYVFVPPYVPHREENPSPDEEAVVVIARSRQEGIVVNLPSLWAPVDIEPDEQERPVSERFQVSIDCQDPHALAAFWAMALGYELEETDEFIRGLQAQGAPIDDQVTTIDGKLVWKAATALRDPAGVQPRVLFQQVPEDKHVKNRVHLDVTVGEERRAEVLERLTSLGARRLWDGEQGPWTWVTMADPEGNEFCVT